MASLHLDLPDSLKARLQERAAESGYASVEQFAKALLEASTEEELLDDDLEALLLERLADPRPGIEFTEHFKDEFRRQIEQRRQQLKE